MRFQLELIRQSESAEITLNYAYPLSAAIYKIIQSADAEYSEFLHNAGYGNGPKKFKLFTFSQLSTPFQIKGDRMVMKGLNGQLQICFYLKNAAETFIKGLFLNRQLELADRGSRVVFLIQSVEVVSDNLPLEKNDEQSRVFLTPKSPLIVGRKNKRGNYDFLAPTDADYSKWLIHNWVEKWAAINDTNDADLDALREKIRILVRLSGKGPQQRVIAIKQGTPEETKVKGFLKFGLEVEAPRKLVDLALGAGLGLYNAAVGGGCVEVKSLLSETLRSG